MTRVAFAQVHAGMPVVTNYIEKYVENLISVGETRKGTLVQRTPECIVFL